LDAAAAQRLPRLGSRDVRGQLAEGRRVQPRAGLRQLERFSLRWNRASGLMEQVTTVRARLHLSGNARTGDMCCSRHIPSGRFRPDGICSSFARMADQPLPFSRYLSANLVVLAPSAVALTVLYWTDALAGRPALLAFLGIAMVTMILVQRYLGSLARFARFVSELSGEQE